MANTSRPSRIIAPLIVLLLVGLGLTQRQNIYDWLRLQGYDPPARIEQLASDTTMSPLSRKLFFVHRPEMDDKEAFSAHCPVNERTIVLGCYITHQRIYLLSVTDERLKGVEEVTAAHEMLHAAYDRLSSKEKQDLNSKLTAFAATLTNQRLLETIESYRKQDPAIVPNELHSILGTEVRTLTPELEEYYSRYFDNRLKIVEFSEQYEKAFTDIKNQIEAYDQQLASLKGQIDSNEQQLGRLNAELSSDRRQLDAYLQDGDNERYNAAVSSYNQKVRRYNNLLASTQRLVDEYNSIVQARNALAGQQHELLDAIDANGFGEQ